VSGRAKYRPYSLQVEVPWDLHTVFRWENGKPSRIPAYGIWVIVATADGFIPTIGSLCLVQPSTNPRHPQYVQIEPGMKLGSHPAPARIKTGEE